jgi:thiamine biosynthesis lipoprotein
MSELAIAARPAEVAVDVPSMGGRLRIRVACEPDELPRARQDVARLARRIERWASRLSRFDTASELSALNAEPEAPISAVGPTLGAVLSWAVEARRRTQGVVDVTLLDARLAAEAGTSWEAAPRSPVAWSLERRSDSRQSYVARGGRARFDLDGVAKGWIADRALAQLRGYAAAIVDADGDIAVSVDPRTGWVVDVDDPDDTRTALASIALDRVGLGTFGVATSGIDVHRWGEDVGRHHLIDPATARPARTDLRQCTVVAVSAALAEAVAKAVIIRDGEAGGELAGGPGVLGAVLLYRSGEVVATEQVLTWLV